MFSVADAVYVLEGPFPQLPDTAQRPIEPALWQRQGLIVPDRTDLGRDSNRCAPIREVLRHILGAHEVGKTRQQDCDDTCGPMFHATSQAASLTSRHWPTNTIGPQSVGQATLSHLPGRGGYSCIIVL
jgi:hypothetical protein